MAKNGDEDITKESIEDLSAEKWVRFNDGIAKITVKGFKSIAEECEIDIRPLTILAGANSSGKSSIIQPLLMMKQTLEAPYDPGPLLIDGPNVQFTSAEQFLSQVGENKADRFHIGIKTSHFFRSHSVTTTFRKGEHGIEIVQMAVENQRLATKPLSVQRQRWTLYPDMPVEEIKAFASQYPAFKDFDVVRRSRCFLDVHPRERWKASDITQDIEHLIFSGIHLPRLRGNPERAYKLTSAGPWYPGTFENYTASVIHEWQETKDERLKTLTDALQTLGLTGQVRTQKIGDTGIELQVGRSLHPRNSEIAMVNIADVGFGVSQVLPVLVALIAADSGEFVYIEKPELHLHPRAQVALAQVLADAAKRRVLVVTETHSSLLLLAVQTLVAEGYLSPDSVKLHWFTRREDDTTEVKSTDLDEAGTYGEWPVDFDDVDLKTQSRYIKAAQSRFVEGT